MGTLPFVRHQWGQGTVWEWQEGWELCSVLRGATGLHPIASTHLQHSAAIPMAPGPVCPYVCSPSSRKSQLLQGRLLSLIHI